MIKGAQSKKVTIDGLKFDSQKEAKFYTNYIKGCGYKFDVHPRFVLTESYIVDETKSDLKIRQIAYTPDFIVYDKGGTMKHVYDVKNSFGVYGIDNGANLRFKLFAQEYGVPVECVVIRTHDFKSKIISTTRKYEPDIRKDVDYDWWE